MNIVISFTVRRAVLFLLSVTLLVLGIGVVADALNYLVRPTPAWIGHLHGQFNVQNEGNVASWWSSVLLLLAAVMLANIGRNYSLRGARFATHWWFLAAVFMFLSIDEAARVHEMLSVPLRRGFGVESGPLRYAWIVPYLAGLTVLFLAYLPLFRHLPRTTRNLIFASAAIFIGGAVGMEMGEAWWASVSGLEGQANAVTFLLTTTEESMEMLGMVLFFYTLASFTSRLPAAAAQPRTRVQATPGTAGDARARAAA